MMSSQCPAQKNTARKVHTTAKVKRFAAVKLTAALLSAAGQLDIHEFLVLQSSEVTGSQIAGCPVAEPLGVLPKIK